MATLGILVTVAPAAAQEPDASAPADAPACVAVVLPSVKGATGDATAFASALRDLLVSYLSGPSLRAIAIDARLPAQAVAEAQQKACGHLLLTSLTRQSKGGGGWGRAMGRAAGAAAYAGMPYGRSATAAAARGAAMGGAEAISSMASATRARDEMTLEYRIGPVDVAQGAPPTSHSAKASSDGEDILTPLVEKAAEAVAAVVVRQ